MKQLTRKLATLAVYLLSALLSSTLLSAMLSGCDNSEPVPTEADVTVPVLITPMPVPTIQEPDPAFPSEV